MKEFSRLAAEFVTLHFAPYYWRGAKAMNAFLSSSFVSGNQFMNENETQKLPLLFRFGNENVSSHTQTKTSTFFAFLAADLNFMTFFPHAAITY